MTKAGNNVFVYDDEFTDRIKSYNGKEIIYSSTEPGNPESFDGKTYTFEGRRLLNVKSSNLDVSSNNDQGFRTSKVINENNNFTETKYIYDGNLLVAQLSDERIDFLYDENNILYGFVLNATDKYFYIRDCFLNINGIIGQDGSLVVKYNYDSYGNLINFTEYNVSIARKNPFRYKGYYYDSEFDMYYCHTRPTMNCQLKNK